MLTYLIRLEMSKMDIMENLIRKNVTLGIEYYKLKYPDEEFQVPEVIISFDFHKDTINPFLNASIVAILNAISEESTG